MASDIDASTIVKFIKTKYPKVVFSPFKLAYENSIGFIVTGGRMVIGFVNNKGELCKLAEPIDLKEMTNESITSIIKRIPIVTGFTEDDKQVLMKIFESTNVPVISNTDVEEELRKQITSNNAEYKVMYDSHNNEMLAVKAKYESRILELQTQYQEMQEQLQSCKRTILNNADQIAEGINKYREEVQKTIEDRESRITNLDSRLDELEEMKTKMESEKEEIEKRLNAVLASEEETKRKGVSLENDLIEKDVEVESLKASIEEIKSQLTKTTDELQSQIEEARMDGCKQKILTEKEEIVSKIKDYNERWVMWSEGVESGFDAYKQKMADELKTIKKSLQHVLESKATKESEYEILKTETDAIKENLEQTIREQMQKLKEREEKYERELDEQRAKEALQNDRNGKEDEARNEEIEQLKDELRGAKALLEEMKTKKAIQDVKKDYDSCLEAMRNFATINNQFYSKQMLLKKLDEIILKNKFDSAIVNEYETVKAEINKYIDMFNFNSYAKDETFIRLMDSSKRDDVSDDEKQGFCEKLTDVYQQWKDSEADFDKQVETLEKVSSYFEKAIQSSQPKLPVTSELSDGVLGSGEDESGTNKYSRGLEERIKESVLSLQDKRTIDGNDINPILDVLKEKFNIFKETSHGSRRPDKLDVLTAIDVLKGIRNEAQLGGADPDDLDSSESGSTDDSMPNSTITGYASLSDINELLRTYVEMVKYLTTSPAMIKLTSLGLKEIRDVIYRKDIQLWYQFSDESRVMRKRATFSVLQTFLYVEVTPLTNSDAVEVSTFKARYIDPANRELENDTNNFLSVITGDKQAKYLYIKRFADIITNLLSSDGSGFVEYMKNAMANYVTNNVYLLLGFSKIYSFIEGRANEQLQVQLNELLTSKVKNNVLTYVKIRNDDGKNYNNRFKVEYNRSNDIHDRTLMLIKYNDHNMPYYEWSEGKWSPSTRLREDWDTLTDNRKDFASYFRVKATDMDVVKYDATYAVGPFSYIFPQGVKNREIASDMTNVIDALVAKKPVFVIGYGASGAGKTSTLIYFNKGEDENAKDGILMHICNIMGKVHGYKSIALKSNEFLRKRGEQTTTVYDTPAQESDMESIRFEYNEKVGRFELAEKYVHVNRFQDRVGQAKTEFAKGTKLGKVVIHLVDSDRFVKATTNNPNSSRSHTLIFIKFQRQVDGRNEETTLMVGDFAGVENLFNCQDDEVIEKFLSVKRDDSSGRRFYSSVNSIGGGNEGYGSSAELCEKFIEMNEDLYVFGPTTSIREVAGDETNKFIRTNKYFSKTENYHEIQRLLAEVIAEPELPEREEERGTVDPFKVLQNAYNSGIDLFTQNAEEDIMTQVTTSVEVLNEFKKLRPDPTSTPVDIEVRKKQFFKSILSKVPSWSYMQAPEDRYDGVIKILSTVNKKTKMLALAKEIRDIDPEFFPSNMLISIREKKIADLVPSVLDHFKTRRSNINRFISGNTEDSQDLYDLQARNGRVKLIKKASMKKFIYEWKMFFDTIVFKLTNMKLDNDNSVFEDTWNALTNFYKTPAAADAFVGGVQRVIPYIYTELHDIIVESSCRMKHGKTVCETRRNEGVMINNSLKDVRDVIKRILVEKNKGSINISPAFIEACLPSYCTSSQCFPMDRNDGEISSDIFNAIKRELIGEEREYEDLRDLILGVFCVLNLSRSANNPPPVPYIDVNNLWYEVKNSNDIFKKTSRFVSEAKKIMGKMKTFRDKVKELLTSDVYINFEEVVKNIENEEVRDEESDFIVITTFLEAVDKISSASAIGTLQFVDGISKFNTTKMICNEDNIKDKKRYKDLLTRYSFVDIVKTQLK
jgi:hypothetical protein